MTLPHLAFKSALLKPFEEFGTFWARDTHLLAWIYDEPFSAPNSDISVCLASLCIGAHKLMFGNSLAFD